MLRQREGFQVYQQAYRRLRPLLEELTGKHVDRVKPVSLGVAATGPDFLIRAEEHTFVAQTRSSGSGGAVSIAIRAVESSAREIGVEAIPLVVVPYMEPSGRRLCREASVSWLDLSGNAEINAPGLRVLVEGRANRFARRGRPSDVFAPKSSRVARQLLLTPGRSYTQRELAELTGLTQGFVNRIVRNLEADGLLARDIGRTVRVRDPNVLLDTWRERYDFFKHRILRGHVAARSGEALLGRWAGVLAESEIRFAATGLAGAWLLAPFAAFRTVSLYVESDPEGDLLKHLGFREESAGPNVWLVIPRDQGVFTGLQEREGIPCAHPLQVYLDLKAHPERANEAAERLREACLNW